MWSNPQFPVELLDSYFTAFTQVQLFQKTDIGHHWGTQHKKWSSPSRIFSVNVTKSAGTADLVTFTEEILNGKLDFFCSGWWVLRKLGLIARAIEGALIKLHFHYTSLFVSATRRRKYIKIPLCLSGPVRKS